MNFLVTFTEEITFQYEVEAITEEEAQEKAFDIYNAKEGDDYITDCHLATTEVEEA